MATLGSLVAVKMMGLGVAENICLVVSVVQYFFMADHLHDIIFTALIDTPGFIDRQSTRAHKAQSTSGFIALSSLP